MNLNFRTIGKFSFLLAIIGFFMPMVTINISGFAALFASSSLSRLNGFQFAEILFESDAAIGGIVLYIAFIFVLAGFVIGVLLLFKKVVPIFVDWVILIISLVGALFFLGTGAADEITLHSGVYVLTFGLVIALILQIISIIKKEKIEQKTSA